jgi:hypothetical protein
MPLALSSATARAKGKASSIRPTVNARNIPNKTWRLFNVSSKQMAQPGTISQLNESGEHFNYRKSRLSTRM